MKIQTGDCPGAARRNAALHFLVNGTFQPQVIEAARKSSCLAYADVRALAPDRSFRHLRRTLRGSGELCRNLRGLRRRAPAWRLAAVAPGARPIKGVHAEFVGLLHLADPGR